MDNKELRAKLLAVTQELEKVEVRGKDNMAHLLGSINFLNNLFTDLGKEESENQEE